MSKIRLYFPKILLTFLLVFVLTGTELTLLGTCKFLTRSEFETVIEQQNLEEKAYASLESYFQSRANSTGIPAEVYLDAIDKETLKYGILSSADGGFGYLRGFYDNYASYMDLQGLVRSISQFFNDYADENNYQKNDAVFRQKVQDTIDEAESEIYFVTDTFKFSTMYENGWLAKARKAVVLMNQATIALSISTVILLVLLMLCCRKKFSEFWYWLGIAGLTSGLLLSAPCLYALKADYFSRFVVKDPQIFAAVVGYLQLMTNQILTTAVCTFIMGAVFLVIFSIFGHKNDKM